MLEDGSQVEELMELTAQSLVDLEIQDRFDVIKEIGRGKYGRVLLVTHRCRGTPMALKVMPKASTQLQGFLREYCISLHLSGHPCIVGLFGIAFRSTEHYCFAQELVIGRDLFAVIQPKVGIPEASVKRCALQISSALEFIHRRGLVHRDVKPENVLLLDTRCCRVKLADFGLAQRRGAFIRFISGTLPYSAPELCARVLQEGRVNAPPLSVEPSLDTWAFGVLLFCILTGYFPWEICSDKDDFYQEWSEWSQAMGQEGGKRGEMKEQDRQKEGDTKDGRIVRDVKEEKREGDKEWSESGAEAGGKEGERQEGRREGEVKHEEGEQGREEEEVPPLWRKFTPDALQMFRRLLAVEPERRSSVSEVQAYVQQDWLKQAPPTDQATPTVTSPDQTPPTTTNKATPPLATPSLAPPTETSSRSCSETL